MMGENLGIHMGEELLKSLLLDVAPVSLFLFKREGALLYVNDMASDSLGYRREDLMAKNFLDLIAEEHTGQTESRIKNLSEKKLEVFETAMRRLDGSIIPVEARVRSFHMDGHAFTIAISRDITEHKQLEAQFIQAQKMEAIGRLAGSVAHDFNNLLTAISGFGNFIKGALLPGDPKMDDIEEILSAADRASNLTRQLIAFSRRQVISPRVFDLNELVANMNKILRRLIREDIEFVLIPSGEPLLIKADPGMMEQVIINLVINARDAMPNGGRLSLETSGIELDENYAHLLLDARPGKCALLIISDSGCGMTDEVKKFIFEPFFTTKEASKGTGLGLATVYGIVKQHNGNIWVYSEPGQGTTFKIYIPLAHEKEEGPPHVYEVSTLPHGKETILVAEDAQAVRSIAVLILKELGYQILEAENGSEALKISQDYPEPIHLLLTDVVMPLMNGKVLAENLRVERPDAKVLFVSGYTDDHILSRGILEHGTAFLQKPFTAISLAHKVREVLDRQ
jgi:two-component system, cell cycle sensor histidine kinase and response regulator CckA